MRGASDNDLQRAQGFGRVVVTGSQTGTRIADVVERSPVRIMFPVVRGRLVEEAVLVNTAGGVAGADALEYEIAAVNNAAVTVSTQAAEKVYRALNVPARVTTKLHATGTSKLAWLPQETIFFNSARLKRQIEIDMSSDSELLALECLVLGRVSHGEQILAGELNDGWRVSKDNRLVWADTFRVTGDVFEYLHRAPLVSNAKALATLVYHGPNLEARLEHWRGIVSALHCQCAVTLVNGIIVARFAAPLLSEMRLALRMLLRQLDSKFGGGPFRVPKMWSC